MDDPDEDRSSQRLLIDVAKADLERKLSKSPGSGRLPLVAPPAPKAKEACTTFLQSWISRKFGSGCAILFPMVVTVYVTWWFLTFFDNFFSPLYFKVFGFHVFGLGFITSMTFILLTGVFFSSWMGNTLLNFGEWLIRRVPLIKHIYSASKQVSAALNPENEAAHAFQQFVLIKHPRVGEMAFGFITGRTVLQTAEGEVRLNVVYVPTNHVYVGDVFLLEEKDIVHTNLTVREGIEIVVSVGMAIPPNLLATNR